MQQRNTMDSTPEYFDLTPQDLKRFFNKDIESDQDFPSPSDACMIDTLQRMSPEQREQWFNNR
jgi:hypothetical protein